jgi:transposase, IS5 family
MIQYATFIHSDPGHAKADKPRGDEASKKKQRLNMDKEGK